MKQKRKVKSLISSKDGKGLFFMTLLFLLGGIFLFGAITLLTSSVSAEEEGEMDYVGIDDVKEVLLELSFAHSGGTSVVNSMYLSGNNFFMGGNAGISLDDGGAAHIDNDYINYLGGKAEGGQIILKSDNITMIGGKGGNIFEGNDNAVILGGIANKINVGNSTTTVAPVIVGGSSNEIGGYQKGNAIVGGQNNLIGNNASYDFVLGGSSNTIGNSSSNVIVGGHRVKVAAGKSNLFVYSSDESTDFTPEDVNAFYLNVKHGLGLNKAASNSGVDSYGAVSFGAVNIFSPCTADDVGVQGTWNGCLVGCTRTGVQNLGKWEMIDHGDACETRCKNYDDNCMVNPIEPEKPDDYTSYCTTGGVNTANATQCAENRLGDYENVIYETYLIDSDDECPYNSQNKCVFRCDQGYHLTGKNVANKTSDVRCYKNCTLPWDENEERPHNTLITGYNIDSVRCSNYAFIFPENTAIINVPNVTNTYYTYTYHGIKKATTGYTNDRYGHSYESCTRYDHKKTLVCNDGTWYIANSNGTPTSTKADGGTGAKYEFETCALNEFNCATGVGYYNLTKEFIANNDQNVTYYGSKYDRYRTNDTYRTKGDRGVYELCVDWVPNAGSNSTCHVQNENTSYHYKLVKCKDHYSTGTDNDVSPYKCMRSCQIKDKNGNFTRKDASGKEYKHNSVITGYANNSVTCTGTCATGTIVCNDGEWRSGTKNGPKEEVYLYNDCKLNDYVCEARYNVTQAEKNTYGQNSYYDSCTPYSGSNKFTCTPKTNWYDLIDCEDGYHTEEGNQSRNRPSSRNKRCISNNRTDYCNNLPSYAYYDNGNGYKNYEWRGQYYNRGTADFYNEGSWYFTNGGCEWDCVSGYHKEGNYCENNHQDRACVGFLPNGARWKGNGRQAREYVGGSWQDWTPDPCDRECITGCYDGEGSCTNDPDQCEDKIYCSCANAPQYSSCTPYAVMEEGVDCDYDCIYGDDGAGGCLPPPPDEYTCSAGKYLKANATTCSDCLCGHKCSGGTFTKQSYDQGIDSCPSGEYSSAGASSCSTCDGTISADQCSCTPAGGPSGGGGDEEYTCSAGKYLKANATTCSDCLCGHKCSGGTFTKQSYDQGIDSCPSGEYSSAGASSCSTCDGTISADQCSCTPAGGPSGGGGDEEYTCSAGKYLKANATTCSDCLCGHKCSGGTFTKQSYDQGIDSCPSGEYSSAGASSCNACNRTLSADQCSCVKTHAESTCTSTHYNCTDGGETNTGSDSSKWTWDCPDQSGCIECKDGYHEAGNGIRCDSDRSSGWCNGDIPKGSTWTNHYFTQTWNGTTYVPQNSPTPSYGGSDCGYLCDQSRGFRLNGSSCVCENGLTFVDLCEGSDDDCWACMPPVIVELFVAMASNLDGGNTVTLYINGNSYTEYCSVGAYNTCYFEVPRWNGDTEARVTVDARLLDGYYSTVTAQGYVTLGSPYTNANYPDHMRVYGRVDVMY